MTTALVIGRFALPQERDVALVRRALASADAAIVVVGSAFHARTPRDPLGWRERAAALAACLPEADRARLRFVPVRDYFDDRRWVEAVRAAVAREAPGAVKLFAFEGRRARAYEAWFPEWRPEAVAPGEGRDPGELGCVFMQRGLADSPSSLEQRRDAALAVLARWIPAPALEYLRAWTQLAEYVELVHDQHALDAEAAKWRSAPYRPIFSTTDAVVTCAGHVLLVRRGARPGRGLRALPGGFVDPDERLVDGAMRELREETRIGLHEEPLRHALRRVVVFDHPRRSLRGRTITHAHHFALDLDRLPEVRGGDDAAGAEWVPVTALVGLEDEFFEDHFHILDEFLGLTASLPCPDP